MITWKFVNVIPGHFTESYVSFYNQLPRGKSPRQHVSRTKHIQLSLKQLRPPGLTSDLPERRAQNITGTPRRGRSCGCHIYLVFFFCGDPIPLWPGGFAYRAVRLREEQRETMARLLIRLEEVWERHRAGNFLIHAII